MSLEFTRPFGPCEGCEEAYWSFGPLQDSSSSSGSGTTDDGGSQIGGSNCACLYAFPTAAINYTPDGYTQELQEDYAVFVQDYQTGVNADDIKWVPAKDFFEPILTAFHTASSPVAAWGTEILPLPEAPSPSSRPEETSPHPNACYEMVVVESPLQWPEGAAIADGFAGASRTKKINLSEFIENYVGEMRSVHFNLRGGDVDESETLGAIFARLSGGNLGSSEVSFPGANGAPYKVIIRARKPTDSIRLDRVTTCYASNVDIEFRSPVVFGESGGLRIFGDQPEITRNGKLKAKLRENASAGSTLLKLSTNVENMQASEFVVGDVIIIRGQNDKFGKALSKQTVHVASIDALNNNLTLAEELDEAYQVVYPDSEWEPDLTTGTTLALSAYAALTATANAQESTVNCDLTQLASSGIVKGSIVLVSTAETEHDINPHAHTGGGTPYKNSARLEIKKVIAVDLVTGDVTFDSALVDTYASGAPEYGGITLYQPVTNTVIRGVRASYAEDQLSRNTHGIQIGFGYKCKVVDCHLDGSGGQKGNGIRISNSLDCEALGCRVENPKFSGSGEGYGMSVYYSDRTRLTRCSAEGCRHNFLLQKANHTRIGQCQSVRETTSGIDIHGVRSFNTHIYDCELLGGPGYSSDTDHKSALRVGNTSHACGDFGVLIENCYVSGCFPVDVGQSYAALEIFGQSTDVTMRGCFVSDCDTGVRGGYDNNSVAEPDPILRAIVRNNTWLRVDDILDLKGTSTVDLDDGGLTKVNAALASPATFATAISSSATPNIADGSSLVTTTYTSKSPNRRVLVTCVIPGMSTSVADNAVMTIWADGTCIGTDYIRVQTTGANSGTSMKAYGSFLSTGAAHTIEVRFGPKTAGTTLTVNDRFNNHSTQQPYLLIQEMD